MGIQGLLPLLKECQRAAHIQEYKGQTLGIDAYVWLHRGAYGCAEELATGQTTIKYVKYALHKIHLLRHYGITPYVVFDGGLLPSKKGTEKDRESRREEALAKARALVLQGKHAQARECYVKAVDVTPQMAYQLIKALKAEDVAYVVAPYEADAQLAYLEKRGLIDGVITEDSDLLVFGCRKVLFKLDSDGRCVEIKRENFTMCREVSFSGWSDKEFRQMAILSGCDYLSSIPGLGLKTAHGLMRRYKSAEKVIRFVRLEGQLKVPRNYEDEFQRAELTFVHQRVFCPDSQKLVYLEDLPENVVANLATPGAEELKFIGPVLDEHIAYGIARGDLCPLSKAKMIDIAPDAKILAANPVPVAPAAKGSLKDYFKPSPGGSKSTEKPSAKRNALGELKPNNLFSVKSEASGTDKMHSKPSNKMVKSRFFVPPIKGSIDKQEIVAIDDSDGEEAKAMPEELVQPPRDENMKLSADSACNNEEVREIPKISGPVTPRETSSTDEDPSVAAQSAHESWSDIPTINKGQKAKVLTHINLPPMPLPAPAAPTELDIEESVLTSPTSDVQDSPERPRKLRRYQSRERDPDATMVAEPQFCSDDDTTPCISSPPMLDAKRSQHKIPNNEQSCSPLQADLVDLTNLSSPTSLRSPRSLHSKREGFLDEDPHVLADVPVDLFWSDEAIVSDPEHGPESSVPTRKARLPSPAAKRQVKKDVQRLQRRNAVTDAPDDAIHMEDEEVQQKMADFDKRVVSVVAGWRSKFASSAAKPAKKFLKLSSSSSPTAARIVSPEPFLSPRRPTKQVAAAPECSSPIMSSTPPSVRKPARAREELESPVKQGERAVGKASASLSQSTSRALEAFRYRSSAGPASSSFIR